MNDWNNIAKCLLKAELIRRNISNLELVNMLKDIGVNETKSSIASKISRGKFSAAFFLQCLSVIGCEELDVKLYNYSNRDNSKKINLKTKKAI